MGKKKESLAPEIGFVVIALMLTGITPGKYMDFVMFAFCVITAIYCDNSGIRLALVKWLPENFPFYSKLSKKRKSEDFLTERYKTIECLCFLGFMFPVVRYFAMVVFITIPIISIYRYIFSGECISFIPQKERTFSATEVTILFPGMLFLGLLENQEINSTYFLLSSALSLMFVIPFFAYQKEYRKKKIVAFLFPLFVMMFSFGTIGTINRVYDFSEHKEHNVKVLEKDIHSGSKTTDYIIEVSEWSDSDSSETFIVTREEYESVEIGDRVTIIEGDGLLKMKWYDLEVNEEKLQ